MEQQKTSLNLLFDEAYKIYESLENRDDPSNSTEFQGLLKKCILMLEDSTRLVSIADMFSKNETSDEIPTEHLKFLLLPFFLAQTTIKLCNQDRSNVLDVSKTYYEDFLARCEDYGLGEKTATAVSKSVQIDARDEIQRLTQMAHQRNQKVLKYQQKKELQDQLKKMKIEMNENNDHIDEELKRKFYIKLIKLAFWDAQDEILMLEQEMEIIKHMDSLKKSGSEDKSKSPGTSSRPPVTPLKPIIITRDNIQKAVYGMGYPSLPTYTVKEFYDQRVADGVFPSEAQLIDNSLQVRVEKDSDEEREKTNEENERKIEADDAEYLARTRNMDEYKDEHRRGSGNRHNRS